MTPVSSNFSATAQELQSIALRISAGETVEPNEAMPLFLLNVGELTANEKADASFDCVREYRELKSMRNLPQMLNGQKTLVLNEGRVNAVSREPEGCWDSLAYYLGFTRYLGGTRDQVGDHLVQISNRRIAQINEFLQQNAPTNLVDFRNICVRASNFAQETLSMRNALKMDLDALDQDTEALSCLAYIICKFVQGLLSLIFSTPGLAQHDQLDRNIGEMNELLYNLYRGRFNNTPNSNCGVHISDFRMLRWSAVENRQTERDVSIYAYPYSYINSVRVLTGETVFVLSEGDTGLGNIRTQTIWASADGFYETTEDNSSSPLRAPLQRCAVDIRHLAVHDGADANDRASCADRPVMKALMQLSVELFARSNGKKLKYHSVYDQVHVLLSGGAIINNDIDRTSEPGRLTQTERIWNRIHEARFGSGKFPEYRDENGIEMHLENSPKLPVRNVKVDFGDGGTTWGEIILANPMLKQPSTDPILPTFWQHNLFLQETPEPQVEE